MNSLRARILLFFTGWLAACVLYYIRLNPILNWIHSDHAVPYLMANTPFAWADIFFWGTDRFGTPYPFFLKSFYLLFGPIPANIFFWSNVFLVLAGISSLWLLKINPLTTLLFMLLLLPLNPQGVHDLLLPASYYGMSAIFLAITLMGCIRKKVIWISLGIFFTLLIHRMMGFLGVAIFLGFCVEDWPFWKQKVPIVLPIALLEISLLVFLRHKAAHDSFQWIKLASGDEIIVSLKIIFFKFGLIFDGEIPYLGVLFLLVVLSLGFYVLLKNRNRSGLYWGGLLLGWTLSGMIFIACSNWFLINNHHSRYVYGVTLGSVLILCVASYFKLINPWLINISLSILLFLKPLPLLHGKITADRFAEIVKEAELLDCKSVIGDYWNTYFIGAWTNMKILGSPLDVIRNQSFHERVLAQRPLCFVPSSSFPQLPQEIANQLKVVCKSGEENYQVWKCHAEK